MFMFKATLEARDRRNINDVDDDDDDDGLDNNIKGSIVEALVVVITDVISLAAFFCMREDANATILPSS